MVILFCISLIGGAVLFHSGGFSLGEISFIGVVWGGAWCAVVRGKRVILLGLALAGTVLLGALRLWVMPVHDIHLGNRAFTGRVERVDERLDKTLVQVRVDESEEAIQVTLREKQSLLPGDHVSVRGKVELPKDFVTDTGRVFDYDQYLSSKGVDAVVGFGQVVKIQEGGVSFTRIATVIRGWIAAVLSAYIMFPVDGIVAGMLVGFQGGIPSYLSDIFRDTGTLHTLVLSGYNITVLAGFLGLILRRVPFRLRTVLVAIGILTLVLVSGAGVAAVRAGIMGGIALLAGVSLRTYSAFRALILAALFFFFVSPMTIFVDPGFHLSFLATLFIITLLPLLTKKLTRIPEGKLSLRETLVLAVGLPLFMLPYMMYFSGLFPWVSPLANIFLVPVIPLLMLGGLGVTVLSFIPFIAQIVGSITGVVGSIAIAVLTLFSSIPQWNTPPIPGWCVLCFYCLLYGLLFRKEMLSYLAQLRILFRPPTN